MSKIMETTYNYFRRAWDEEAAFHLARARAGEDWRERLISAFWLMGANIPYSGAAPSMQFEGLK